MPKKVKRNFTINHKVCYDAYELADELGDNLTKEQRKRLENFKELEVWEQDIFMLYSQGYSLREIASKLDDVSFYWVWARLKEINEKLNKK